MAVMEDAIGSDETDIFGFMVRAAVWRLLPDAVAQGRRN
jgi:hypothetical protein